MKKWLVVSFAAAVVAGGVTAVAEGSKVDSGFPQPYGFMWDKASYTDEFKRQVADGVQALKRGDAEKGIATLMRAMRLTLRGARTGDEASPNFELWDDIAIAACKRSDWAMAQSLLADYRCVVEKTVHEFSCYVGEDFDTRVPNASMTPMCFKEVCGDLWKQDGGVMGPASSDDPAGTAASLNELQRVDRLIKKCTGPQVVPR
ncbi:MAG: hypothetical protein KBA31_19465 [Alphaproteobacteria bacterium]|nr:hypothetical protein [Alphaproteobacteria bacterium]